MSRGLGKLQRFIKEQVYRADREWNEELDRLIAAKSSDHPKGTFWLTWPDIRYLIAENAELNDLGPDCMSETLERSAKRALHLLVKRGELAKITAPEGALTRYGTKGTDKAMEVGLEEFAEDLKRAAASKPPAAPK
jgi:hypothetical protein